jgi:methylglutaconyl-CoA hydratase
METILFEQRSSGVAVLTLNRPAARNALSRQLARELTALLDRLQSDEALRAVVVAGAGERAFCAGADLQERQAMSAAERTAHTEAIAAAFDDLAMLPVPTIAAIRGYALAGGAELALACDLRIGGGDAVLGLPEVKIGIFPGAGGVLRLPRVVGAAAANDLLFTGRQVSAEEALQIGLLNEVVAPDVVVARAIALAETIAANAPLAIRALKRALLVSAPGAEAVEAVRRERRSLDETADYAEGLSAFAEKRAPRFTGR